MFLVETIADALHTERTGNEKVLIMHCCNDVGLWGKGFVKEITLRYGSKIQEEYREWYRLTNHCGRLKLGSVQFIQYDDQTCFANMIAQYGVRTFHGVPPIRYDSLQECLIEVFKFAVEHKYIVRCPLIGCGLAGGDWNVVQEIIRSVGKDVDVRVEVCKKRTQYKQDD